MLKLLFKTTLFITVSSISFTSTSSAQVVPDQTLGTENSSIRSIDELRDEIQGGATRGENLFHSFQEFNIREGASVNFANPNGITNIFSRVTGGNISEILGTLGADGAANLFLMNPNGIVFGENAAIDIRGSFLATTAETINFGNGSKFSSIEPSKSILTIDSPIGLELGNQSGSIFVEDAGHSVVLEDAGFLPIIRQSNAPGLQVSSGKNLALIGAEINLDGGILISEGGRIELAGVKDGNIGLDPSPDNSAWKFEYSSVSSFGDVNLENTSWIDASSTPQSVISPNIDRGINIVGQDIVIQDESLVLIQNQVNTSEGKIEVNANNSFTISKVEIDPIPEVPGGLISETLGSVSGADIFVTSPEVSLVDGGSIISKTFGPAKSGNITVEASKGLLLSGSSTDDIPPVPSNISQQAFFNGQTGVTNIDTPSLLIEDGATVINVAVDGGNGDDITINATNIKLEGLESNSSLLSSNISSTASGESQAANIFLNTSTLEIEEGAAIVSNGFNLANPGSINIDANDFVQVRGSNSQISSSVSNLGDDLQEDLSLLEINDAPLAIGDSQDVNIKTNTLQIVDEAVVSVLNFGIGNGGNLNIEANSVKLQNQGNITATAASGQGGNITLGSDFLELLNQSQITSSAGGTGDGGNITLGSGNILGIENSDITANAVGGSGGNIDINSDAILGLEARSQLTPLGDITATSDFGIDGTININSPDIDFESEVFAALQFTISQKPFQLLKRKCLNPRRKEGKLLFIGRGGVPENPRNFFDDEEIIAIDEVSTDNRKLQEQEPEVWKEGDPLIESNKVMTAANGDVYLVAETQLESKEANVCNARSEVE